MIFNREIPAAFMASNSKRSPKFPKVIKGSQQTLASGNDAGTNVKRRIKEKLCKDSSSPILFLPFRPHTSIKTAS